MTTALARRFKVDVSTDNATWIPFKGIDDLNPQINPNTQAADTYDTDGWNSFEITMQGWVVTIKALRPTASGVFDPGQELVRACRAQFGDEARIYVRWYDRNDAPEAYSGLAIVQWNPSKTGVADLDEVAVTLTGDGILTPISNPGTAPAAPIVISAGPSAVAVGGMVEIKGSGFAGATNVKFTTVAATSFIVISDSVIVAVMPAGSTGSAPVTVINSVGTSNALPYTRGA